MPSADTHSADALLSHKDEDDNEYSLPETPRKRRYKKTVTGISICVLAVAALATTYSLFRSRDSGFIPIISNSQVIWEPDNRFDASPDRHSAWTEMMPRGKGFVKVPFEYQQGLGPGKPMDEDGSEYCLSVFHQLHCLATLRSALNSLRYGDNGTHGPHDDHPIEHVDHCIDYLRQAVMCSGDMTLEHFPVRENGRLEPFVDGWSVTHQCKNWDEIMKFTNEHRSSDVRAID